MQSNFGSVPYAHFDYIHQLIRFHVGPGCTTPRLEVALRERERRLVEAVQPHAPEHRASLCKGIINKQ